MFKQATKTGVKFWSFTLKWLVTLTPVLR